MKYSCFRGVGGPTSCGFIGAKTSIKNNLKNINKHEKYAHVFRVGKSTGSAGGGGWGVRFCSRSLYFYSNDDVYVKLKTACKIEFTDVKYFTRFASSVFLLRGERS